MPLMEYNICLPRQHHLAEQSSSVRVKTSTLEVGRDRLLEHYLCQELFFFPLQTHWGNVTKTYSFLVALIPSSIMNIDSSVSELLLPSLQETVR